MLWIPNHRLNSDGAKGFQTPKEIQPVCQIQRDFFFKPFGTPVEFERHKGSRTLTTFSSVAALHCLAALLTFAVLTTAQHRC